MIISGDRLFDIIENMRYQKYIEVTILISWLIREIADDTISQKYRRYSIIIHDLMTKYYSFCCPKST